MIECVNCGEPHAGDCEPTPTKCPQCGSWLCVGDGIHGGLPCFFCGAEALTYEVAEEWAELDGSLSSGMLLLCETCKAEYLKGG